MDLSTSIQIPKPGDFGTFQRKCRVLFEAELGDPHVKEFGTGGQVQTGIDLLGVRRKLGLDHWVGVQCKLTIKAEKLKAGTVRKEAAAALTIEPALKELIIATTAADDVAMDKEAAQFSDEQAKLGRDFRVVVWGWDTLQAKILQHPEALNAFMPGGSAARQLLEGQDRIEEHVTITNAQIGRLGEDFTEFKVLLTRAIGAADTDAQGSDQRFTTHLDQQIDSFRDLLTKGKPQTAFELLENLWNSQSDHVDGRMRFRIRANMAACRLRLGDLSAAADLYLESYTYDPDNARAVSMRVVGLSLKKEFRAAFDLGMAQLGAHPDDVGLVTHTILAARYLDFAEIPVPIPAVIAADVSVLAARIEFLKAKAPTEQVRTALAEARDLHPYDDNILRMWAEQGVEDVVDWVVENGRAALPDDKRAVLQAAGAALEKLWQSAVKSEEAASDTSLAICHNLAVSYRLMKDPPRAEAILEEGLKISPDQQFLLGALLSVLLEQGKETLAAHVLDRVAPTRDSVMARAVIYANTRQWEKLVKYAYDTSLVQLDEDDATVLQTLSLLARKYTGQITDFRAEAISLIADERNAIAPVLLCQAAFADGDNQWGRELFDTAFARKDWLDSAGRGMLARIASHEDRPETVIALLDGYTDLTRNSSELRMLATAYVNAPVSAKALAFAKAIPDHQRQASFFARVIASIQFNAGNLVQAEAEFQNAISGNARDLAAHLGLLAAYIRQDKHKEARTHIAALDPSSLEGTPERWMHLAHLFARYSRQDEALALAYRITQENRDDDAVIRRYIGMILPSPFALTLPPPPSAAGLDSWVILKTDAGQVSNVIIEAGDDRPSREIYSPDHPLALAVTGKAAGDDVDYSPNVGGAQHWTVLEVKHKYLGLLHEILRTLGTQFPNLPGIRQFEMVGNDISPILEQTKLLSERDQTIVDYYAERKMPLAMAASLLGKSSPTFAERMSVSNIMIQTCGGATGEREAAFEYIKAASGVVLDTYTAWLSVILDLIPVLKNLFARIAIPQSVIDELIAWRQEYESHGDEPIQTIGYKDGQYFREEVSPDRVAAAIRTIQSAIDQLRSNFEVVPAVIPDLASEFEQKLHSLGGSEMFHPVYAAKNEGLLFLSDDMLMRGLAHETASVDGVWLQAVLMIAYDQRLLSLGDYAEAVLQLALRGHNHVTLEVPTLNEILLNDDSDGVRRFEGAVKFIGNENADVRSHWEVGWGFVQNVWALDIPHLKRAAASGIMLRRIATLLNKHGLLQRVFSRLLRLRHGPELGPYLAGWCRGHFIFAAPPQPDKRSKSKSSPRRRRT